VRVGSTFDMPAGQAAVSRRLVLFLIKPVHTIAFAVIAGAILLVFAGGWRGQPGRWTALPAGVALAGAAIYAGNGFVCPLTPLAERCGARRGSVTDIFLPDWFARNLTWISSSILAVGFGPNLRAMRRGARVAQATADQASTDGTTRP